eukprot:1160212-Pelagomonas_calceolata.AAC.2
MSILTRQNHKHFSESKYEKCSDVRCLEQKAVEAALAKTSLLKEQLQGQDGPLLTRQQRDEYGKFQ